MIPYGRQDISEDDIAAVVRVLRGDYLTTGPAVAEFEAALQQATGAKHAIVCASGTAALHLAAIALDLKPGAVGVTSPITFVASANCIEYVGGRSSFTDIDPLTLCLDPSLLEKRCKTEGPPAVVIPVSFAGIPASLPEIWSLARRYGFRVVEDAAHALGSRYDVAGNSFRCGGCSHSDLAILSFHPVKTITAGEGGAVTTNDDSLAERIRSLRSHGITRHAKKAGKADAPWYYEMTELGFHYRLTDIQCALGTSQLRRLDQFKARRRELVDRYNKAFENVSAIQCPPIPAHTDPCFHIYPIVLAEGATRRRLLYDVLLNEGIHTQVHYIPVYWQPYYREKYGLEPGLCPHAERYYQGALSLPLFPSLTDEQQDRVISLVIQTTST
ncbi:MAG: UDP-4-amino-4,6-dideoxy-N-acetyl-beta-L-altrosamine transaminase [Bdellovibrionales bacterium]|nr:UDP-4-amino-4,6-dideoxy-N-acetyl-beta-L-altrosamine transaminase [Bdellovibrionales bacterium]